MTCAFCEHARQMIARVLRRGRRHVPQPIAPPMAPADPLVVRCCDPQHFARIIEGDALVPATYNLGSAALNEAAARANGWQRRTEGWICAICAARR